MATEMSISKFIAEHGWERRFLFVLPDNSITNMTFSYDICDKLRRYGMKVEKASANYIKLSDIGTEIHIRKFSHIGHFTPDMIFVYHLIREVDIQKIKQLYPNSAIKKFSY